MLDESHTHNAAWRPSATRCFTPSMNASSVGRSPVTLTQRYQGRSGPTPEVNLAAEV